MLKHRTKGKVKKAYNWLNQTLRLSKLIQFYNTGDDLRFNLLTANITPQATNYNRTIFQKKKNQKKKTKNPR